jgi:hypothetical protein
MPHFTRRPTAPNVKGSYHSFRQFVREDFTQQCAYCLLSEILAGGKENFELDHFRPRSLYRHLQNDYYNIYYSCHPCNHIKRDAWPSAELEARGITLVDLCADEFTQHFQPSDDGVWYGLTPAGAYTIDVLRLNRKHLLEIRRLLAAAGFKMHESTVTSKELQRLLNR